MTSSYHYKILFVEDLPSDVDLAILELRKEKINFEHITVCSRPDLLKAIKEFKPDLVISDYMMPTYNGLQALRDVKSVDESIPFILLTGSINEETAVECIKAGAEDYVIKEHMTRLPFAVKEALEQQRIRQEKSIAERLLKDSEERFRTLYNDALVGLYRTNSKGEIMLANKALINMLGFSSFEELAAINLNKSGIGITQERKKFIERIEKEGEIIDLEAVWVCRDGREINVRENAKLIRDSDGKILCYDGTVEDITEKRKAEKELISSLSILNASLDSTADGILIVDGKGGIIKWNRKFSDMWKLPDNVLNTHDDNAAINHILNELTDPENFLSIIKELYLDPEKSSFDKLEFKDGRVFDRYSQPQRINQKVVGRVWSFRDVTENVRNQLELHKLSRAVEQNPASIVITDTNGIIEYVNPKMIEVTGYSKEELTGKNPGILSSGETSKDDYKVLWNTIKSGKEWKGEFHNRKKMRSLIFLVLKRISR
jgi:PAS domain S-box-containing protein